MKAFWLPLLSLSFLLIGVLCSMGQSIRVESAYYGSRNGAGADVTQTVQRFADYGEPFRVNNDTLSTDPSPNDENTLVVVYRTVSGFPTLYLRVKYFTSGAVATPTIAPNTTSLVFDAAYQDCKGLCVD